MIHLTSTAHTDDTIFDRNNNVTQARKKAIFEKTMPHFPLNTDDLMGCREIRFIDRQESNYPTLMRLAMDFDCCILQIQHRVYSHISLRHVPTAPEFIITNTDYSPESINALTPSCKSLQDLEAYALEHQVDILHDYLFGDASTLDAI